jgi:hypothetical protein
VNVSANVPWRLEITVEEPCGPSVPEATGVNAQDMAIRYRVGTMLAEPKTIISIFPET